MTRPKPYKLLVAEDEILTRDRIISLLQSYPEFEVVAQTENGPQTLEAIKAHQPDVVLLDIKMPVFDGFEVLNRLDKKVFKTLVFITAYDQYAIQAFEHEALDYLLKPFNRDRFDALITRLKKRLVEIASPESYLLLRANKEVVRLKTKDIIYLQAQNNHVLVHTANAIYRKRISLRLLLQQLDHHFIRIHRSYVLNERKILKMRHVGQGDYFFSMSNGKSIPSSQSYRKQVSSLTK